MPSTSTPGASVPSNIRTFSRGEIIAEQGSTGEGWHVLLSGRVAVFKNGTQIAEFDTRGVVFGEISSILSRPRTARLVAVEPTSVLYFEADLDELVTKYPKVAKTVLVSLAQRLERTTEALWSAIHTNNHFSAVDAHRAAHVPLTGEEPPPPA